MNTVITEKNLQRQEMKKKRAAMSAEIVKAKSKAIAERFLTSDMYKNAKTVMIYLSAKNEPDTFFLAEEILKSGRALVVPITNAEDGTLTLSYLYSTADLVCGAFGIKEPKEVKLCLDKDIDLVAVPGLVFDRLGGRIGYGKGYYDRVFERVNALRAALCYDFQVVAKAAEEEHDKRMDYIFTESRVIDCAGK